MIDPLAHVRALLEEFRRSLTHAPGDDFVREVALGAWGRGGGDYEPPPDPGPGGTLLAHWSFAAAGPQVDLTGNGHTLVLTSNGYASDLTGQISAFSVTFTTHAGYIVDPLDPLYSRTSVSVAPAILGGTYGPGAETGTVDWCLSFNPYNDIGDRVELYRNAVLIDFDNTFETLAGSTIRVFGEAGYISDVKVWNSYQNPTTLGSI